MNKQSKQKTVYKCTVALLVGILIGWWLHQDGFEIRYMAVTRYVSVPVIKEVTKVVVKEVVRTKIVVKREVVIQPRQRPTGLDGQCTSLAFDQSETPAKANKNKIALFAGGGPQGISVTQGVNQVDVDQEFRPVVGLGYSRNLTPSFSLEAVGFTNGTLAVGAGFGF